MTRIFHAKVESGQRLVATDITDLTFFPIGSILMMDGSWQDGRGGWYICDGRPTPYGYTPNLLDRFIMGSTGAGVYAGTNSMILNGRNLPSHSHTASDGGHSHGYEVGWHTSGSNQYKVSVPQEPVLNLRAGGGSTTSTAYASISIGSAGSSEAFDNRPSYYTVIYIRKMV
jgi:microcystin-dependent protein